MSIIQTLIGAIVSSGSGGPPPSPNAFAGYSGTPTEGGSSGVTVYVENWNGNRIYWEVVSKGNPAADTNADMTGTLSGFWDPGAVGSASQTVTTINFTADGTTEGTEFWGVNLGSSPGASDYYSSGDWPIYEPLFYNAWTIEWFQKSNSSQPSQFPRVFGVATYPSQSIGFSIEGTYYSWVAGAGIPLNAGSITHNAWQHWAMVSDGTTLSVYRNGARVATAPRTNYGQILNAINDFYVGIDSNASNGYKGLITNFRVVKGLAMYDAGSDTITVPTAPLGSNAYTELLLRSTNIGNVYTDSSSRARIPAGTNANAFSSDTPFIAPTPAGPYTQYTNQYSSGGGYIGGSIDFSGGNYNADLLNVKAGWIVTNGATSGYVVNDAYEIIPGTIRIDLSIVTTSAATWTFTQYQVGGSIEFYTSSSYGMLRYLNSTAWALDTPSKVQLTSGTALGFNGTDNRHVIVADNLADWNLGDNWTIEWWQKIPIDASGFLSVLCQDANVPTYSGIDVFINNGSIQMFNGGRQTSESAATRGEWNHVALQKNGTDLTAYINGAAQTFNGSHPGTIAPSSPLNVVIGSRTADGGANFYGQYFNGQLANIRVSTVARYTTTFTPPTTVEYDVNTRLALDGSVGGGGMLTDELTRHTLTNNGATVDTIS